MLAQELSHCLGEVSATSPDSIPSNTTHSRHCPYENHPPLSPFLQTDGLSVVNFINRQDVSNPRTVMCPFFSGGDDPLMIMEGYDYNHLHATMLSLPSIPSSTLTPAGDRARPTRAGLPRLRTVYVAAGTIGDHGHVNVMFYGRMRGPGQISATTPGPYALTFANRTGHVLARLRFSESFTSPHEHHVSVVPFLLATPLPAGAASMAIVKNERTLLSRRFPAQAPRIGRIRAARTRAGIKVSWSARGHGLTFALALQARKLPPLQIASGIRTRNYTILRSGSFSGMRVRVVVEASDGFHVVHKITRAIRLPNIK